MNTDPETLLVRDEDRVRVLSINRPESLNALNLATLRALREAVEAARQRNEIRALVLTGVGDRAFVAGADIKEFGTFSPEQAQRMVEEGQSTLQMIEDFPKPVIAAINGLALGGGCELAMACHLRIASDKAVLGQPECKLGIIPGYGGTQRLVRLIGPGRALEYMLTGDTIGATDAAALGLVNRVVDASVFWTSVMDLAKRIASMSAIVNEALIRCVAAAADPTLDGFALERTQFRCTTEHADFREGTRAFIEKRPARFR
jgi:enoyl-CoA hydratase